MINKAVRNTIATAYAHPYGDVEIYGLGKWLQPFMPERHSFEKTIDKKEISAELAKLNVLDLEYISLDPWRALDAIEVDMSETCRDARYKCPITHRSYVAILPRFIVAPEHGMISALVQRFVAAVPSHLRDMAIDHDWNKRMNPNQRSPLRRTSIEHCLLGPGYTEVILPSDGSGSIDLSFLALESGDRLLCLHHVWHNK